MKLSCNSMNVVSQRHLCCQPMHSHQLATVQRASDRSHRPAAVMLFVCGCWCAALKRGRNKRKADTSEVECSAGECVMVTCTSCSSASSWVGGLKHAMQLQALSMTYRLSSSAQPHWACLLDGTTMITIWQTAARVWAHSPCPFTVSCEYNLSICCC